MSSSPQRSSERRALRAGKVVIGTLTGLYVGYLALGNLLLGTGLLSTLVSLDPETVTLDYQFAYTLWPGHAHVEGLHIHGSDRTLEWMTELDEGDVDIRLWDLTRRTFHATRLRGEGFSFRVRLRIDAADADDPKTNALPGITGYGNPPMPIGGPPEPTLTDEDYNLWTADLEDVEVTVREVWIQHYRYSGDGVIRGGFYFKPLRAVEIRPSEVTLSGGEVTLAEHVVGRPEALASASSVRFDPREATWANLLTFVTLHLSLEAQLPAMSFLRFYDDPSSAVMLFDGSGELRADLSVREGALAPSSTLSYATSHLAISLPADSLLVTTGGEVRLTTADSEVSPSARFWASAPKTALVRLDGDIPEARAENAWIVIDTPPLDAAHLPTSFRGEAYVPAAVIEDLRILSPLLRGEDAPVIEGGAAFFKARIKVDEAGGASGYLSSLVKHAAFRWKETKLRGDATISLPFEGGGPGVASGVVKDGSVKLTAVTMEHAGEKWPDWWANIDITKAKVGPALIEAAIVAKCKDARPAVNLLDVEGIIPGWAADLFTMEGLVVVAELERTEKRVRLNLRRAEGGAFDIRGRLDLTDGKEPIGAFLITSGILSAGIAIKPNGPTISPFAGDDWLAERVAALGR